VHGVQTPAIGLQPLAKALSTRFSHAHCVLVDLWGHGLTETPVKPYEPALFYALIDALLAHLSWSKAHFVGYSFGASTTVTYSVTRPERVSSMALVAPAGLIRSSSFSDEGKKYLEGGDGLEEAAQAWLIDWLEGGPLIVPEDWKERVQRGEVVAEAVKDWQMKEHKGHTASIVGVFRDGGAMDMHAAFEKAAKASIPYICVLGEQDGVCSEKDCHEVGMTNVAVVPQVGHGVVRQKVADVAELIGAFWEKQ
jgi:pimeloyl-ACP methyl ester carboxylesterase